MSERFNPEIIVHAESGLDAEALLAGAEFDGDVWTPEMVENIRELSQKVYDLMTGSEGQPIAEKVLKELLHVNDQGVHFLFVKYLTMMGALKDNRSQDLKQGITPVQCKAFMLALIEASRS